MLYFGLELMYEGFVRLFRRPTEEERKDWEVKEEYNAWFKRWNPNKETCCYKVMKWIRRMALKNNQCFPICYYFNVDFNSAYTYYAGLKYSQ